ncbi:MAG: hypothetical protein KGI66_01010 [Patescibacteria group bacterium]|nr:hypothetical protein [Patescibacteria group bacterium]
MGNDIVTGAFNPPEVASGASAPPPAETKEITSASDLEERMAGAADAAADEATEDAGADASATEDAAEAAGEDAQEGEETQEADAEESEEQEASAEDAEATEGEEVELSPEESEAFDRLYADHPKLKPFLDKNPELRSAWFRAQQLNEVFTTPQDAKVAKDWATQFERFQNAFYDPTPEGKRFFLQRLSEMGKNADGTSDGHYEAIVDTAVKDVFHSIRSAIAQGSVAPPKGWTQEHVDAAIAGLSQMLGYKDIIGKPKDRAASAEAAGVAPEAAQLSQIEQERQKLSQERENYFVSTFQNQFAGWLNKEIGGILSKNEAVKETPAGFQNWLREEFRSRLKSSMDKDSFFVAQFLNQVRSGDRSPEHIQELEGMLENRARHYLPNIARQVLKEAGVEMLRRQERREQHRASVPKRKETTRAATPAKLTPPAKSGAKGEKPHAKPGESYREFASRIFADRGVSF